ncbi:MAG: helix-turn-helix domain-containing protein, partial [Duncaniella sp.]|uniref:helix-turn-helix domain-containing protein n=1 Tax=Duncaniella sp. TaxID=2518496 RepID=UPI0023D72C92
MDLVSRLKHYLDSRQISITQFADECGIPRPTGSQLLAGRNKKVSDEIISKIHSAYPNLNIVWLMFGEGNMVTNGNIEISAPQNAPQPAADRSQSPTDQTIGFALECNENPRQD